MLATIAAAAVETGAPVMVHTNAECQTGLLGAGGADRAGVDPSRIIIAHAGDSNDMDYLRELAASARGWAWTASGSTTSTRRRSRPHAAQDVDEGYIDQLHVSHDAGCFHDFMVGNPFFADEHPDYLFISQTVLPLLARERRG